MASGRDLVVAGPPVEPEKKEAYYLRLHLLIVKEVKALLKARFDRAIPPHQLHTTLQNCMPMLNYGKKNNLINKLQWSVLFPVYRPPSSDNFDVLLLTYLLRNICGLQGKSKWWNETDNSKIPDHVVVEEADIVRLRNLRNDILQKQVPSLEQSEFEEIWNLAEKTMLRIAAKLNIPGQKQKIDDCKVKQLDLETEKMKSKKAELARNVSEMDLIYISQHIGSNWEMIGPFLLRKNSMATVEQIKDDHRKCQQRVFNLLLAWRRETDDPSLANLFHLIYKAGPSVSIEWKTIAERLEIQISDIQACKTYNQPPVQQQRVKGETGYKSPILQEPVKGQNKTTDPKYSCKFDGRLILLDDDQKDYLESTLDDEPIGQGGIGIVYRSNDLNMFGITVAVKKMKINDNDGVENHIKRERIACRLMHPFILPLLAFVKKKKGEFWLISPYCENGDLYAAIKKSNNGHITDISQRTRVKILLQISLAIQYIHTKINGVRDSILHKDIASKNVVLDTYLNARLIDFGLAREKDDTTTTPGGRIYYEHPAKGHGNRANESWDYYIFGIIIREMLTSLGPEGPKGKYTHYLKNMKKDQIDENIDKNVWLTEKYSQLLNDLSDKCLNESYAWTVAEFEENIVNKLKDIFKNFGSELFENGNNQQKEESENKCHQCIINPIADESSLTHKTKNCRQKIKLCMACEKNSFLNPITCYCGEKLTSVIGSKWGALLVAGDDNDREKAAAMKEEIRELERVITSQAPRVIGISTCKVRMVVPGDTKEETEEDVSPTWNQIQEHITYFSGDHEVDTLLIYISCHGGDKESVFQLGTNQIVKLDEFQKEIEKLKNIDRLILFLDRCFPPMMKLEGEKRKFVQINACSDDKEAVILKEGSMFTKFVIQGLKARSEGKECKKDCKICFEYWDTATKNISVCALFNYVRKHLEEENKKNKKNIKVPEPDWQMNRYWKNIAFFTDEEVKIEFFTFSKQALPQTIPLKYLKTFEDVKEKLFNVFDVDYKTYEVEIHKETFRNREDEKIEKCDSLQKVMQAWIQRFPLTVSFSKKNPDK